jgi:hypothetical protein
MALATGGLRLGLTLVAQTRDETADGVTRADQSTTDLVQRAEQDVASRGLERAAVPAAEPAAPATSTAPAAPAAPADPDTKPSPTKPAPRPKPVDPGPVAGLTVAQMNNAKAIVRSVAMTMPRPLIIAVATAIRR